MIYGSVVLCLSLCAMKADGFRLGASGMRHSTSLRAASTTDNRGPAAKEDPSAYTLAILGDLHLDPRYMDDHVAGQKHFMKIIKDKAGNPKANTCVISLGDLGESKSVYPDKTKELFAGTTGCLQLDVLRRRKRSKRWSHRYRGGRRLGLCTGRRRRK